MTSKGPVGELPLNHAEDHEARSVERIDSAMFILRATPSTKEWNNIVNSTKSGIALTGTAAKKPLGPAIGLVDIGSSNYAYLFRISLPGVCRDPGFSCEIERSGRVTVKGDVSVTGLKNVAHIFEMHTETLCPSGPFSVSFQLPGPVDPKGFSATFDNGIFEAIVAKGNAHDLVKVQMEGN